MCIRDRDRKALQAGTSHFLGQNFAKASGIEFQSRTGALQHAWTTSWGVSTRLIGGMLMVHGDDNGMIMPPRLAPSHVVLLPILRKNNEDEAVLAYCRTIAEQVSEQTYDGKPVLVEVDDRDLNAGEKSWEWIKKGIPVIAEVGPRDMAGNTVFVCRRGQGRGERFGQNKDEFSGSVGDLLADIQSSLFKRALACREENSREFDHWDDFQAFFTPQNKEKPEIHGGFALAHWSENPACEQNINDALAVTIRGIPSDYTSAPGTCIACGCSSPRHVVYAKAY